MNTYAHKPKPGIHIGDYLACEKFTSGIWKVNLNTGEIFSAKTGKPVPFHKNSEGYLHTAIQHKGIRAHVLKHRVYWQFEGDMPQGM